MRKSAATRTRIAADDWSTLLFQSRERLLVHRQVDLLILRDVLDRDLPVRDRVPGVADGRVAPRQPDVGDERLLGVALAILLEDRHCLVLLAGGDERRAVLVD